MHLETLLQNPHAWAVLGLLLIFAELLVPGLILVFLGLGAWVTGVALALGWIQGLTATLTIFFMSSVVFVLGLRSLVSRFLPSERIVSETDEAKLALHQSVEVIEAIPRAGRGRISFRGTTWLARFPEGSEDSAVPGEKVEIFGQDDLTWIVVRKTEASS
jgi:membrane protein implicated in regulation of membrane protease activity